MTNTELSTTFGINRTTLRNWENSENEGRQFLAHILKSLPDDFVRKAFNNFLQHKELIKDLKIEKS